MDTDLNKCYRRRVSTRLTSAAVLAFTLTSGPWLAAQQAAAPAPPAGDPHATVDKYCVNCHNERLKSGGLALDHMDYSDVAASAGVWEKAIKKVRVGMMPPQGAPQPDAATRGAARLAGSTDIARSRGGAQAESRTARAAPPESRRVRERGPRSARARRRSLDAAAAGRFRVRLRQRRRRARRVAGAARAVHGGRRTRSARSRSAIPTSASASDDVPHSSGRVAGHARRRPADRHRRRHPREGDAAARRRVSARP